MDDLKSIIGKVATGATLSREEAASAFDSMMSGEATPSQMGGLLMALRVRGETVDEITGAVSAMRSKMLRVTAPAEAVDVVGTGGEGAGSGKMSTRAPLIRAGRGAPVAEPRNPALSSRLGAAAGAGAEESRLRFSLGRPWLRRARRNHPHRPELRREPREWHYPHLRGDAGRCRPQSRRRRSLEGRRRRCQCGRAAKRA